MAPDQPLAVVAVPEGKQGLAEVLDRGEVLDPKELFFQGPDEALGAAVALWFPHEGRAAGETQEPQFRLEVIAHELAAMIVPQGQSRSDLLLISPEVRLDALPQGLQRLEASAAAGGMNAHTPRRVVIHGDEDRGQALRGPAGGRVGAPHGIGAVRNDGAVVRLGAMRPAHAGRGQEAGGAQQAQHAALAGADPGQAQARPHFAVAFAHEGRLSQHRPNVLRQLAIRPGGLRAPLLQRGRPLPPRPPRVERRARHAQRPAGALPPIDPAGGGRDRPTHRLDLLDTKGWPVSARSARSRSSSFAMVSSPIFARRRARSSSRASVGRLRTPAWPAASNWSRHWASVAAVTPSSRLRASSASPRRIRSTTSVFRREDQRPRSVAAVDWARDRFMDTSLPGHHAPKPVSKKTVEQR